MKLAPFFKDILELRNPLNTVLYYLLRLILLSLKVFFFFSKDWWRNNVGLLKMMHYSQKAGLCTNQKFYISFSKGENSLLSFDLRCSCQSKFFHFLISGTLLIPFFITDLFHLQKTNSLFE